MGTDVQALLLMGVAEMYSLLTEEQQTRMDPSLRLMCIGTAELVQQVTPVMEDH